MNFTELTNELYARGTDYLSEDAASVARAQRWINQAYKEIVNFASWPFLVTTVTGAANATSVSIPDLRRILLVTEQTGGNVPGNKLDRISYEELVDQLGVQDLSATGTPIFYHVEGANSVVPAPVGGPIMVRYLKRAVTLTGTDVPIFDDTYHDLIIDRAMMKAYKDNDNLEAAAALREEYTSGLQSMVEDYGIFSADPTYIDVGDPYDT